MQDAPSFPSVFSQAELSNSEYTRLVWIFVSGGYTVVVVCQWDCWWLLAQVQSFEPEHDWDRSARYDGNLRYDGVYQAGWCDVIVQVEQVQRAQVSPVLQGRHACSGGHQVVRITWNIVLHHLNSIVKDKSHWLELTCAGPVWTNWGATYWILICFHSEINRYWPTLQCSFLLT